jgi:microcystin-dependent protein
MPYVGEIRAFTSELPRAWLPCDGRLLPIDKYQALYSTIGMVYGGDDSTKFALPDLRGRVVAGADPGLNQPIGETSGSAPNGSPAIPYAVARWAISVYGEYPSTD